MGPHKPKFTRADKGRPAPKSRRKPAQPKPSKLLASDEVLRNMRERRADAILKAAKAIKPARTASSDAPRRELDLLRPAAGALREIRQQLDLVCSCAIVVGHALTEQNVELDDDAALVLRRHVSDPLHEQVLRIDNLLGELPRDEGARKRGTA